MIEITRIDELLTRTIITTDLRKDQHVPNLENRVSAALCHFINNNHTMDK